MTQIEKWRPVVGYEGLYDVSNMGNVRSYHKYGQGLRKTPVTLKAHKDKDGYLCMTICKDKKHKQVTIHRLVAEAFVSNEHGYSQIDHINGIKTDNRAENLEFVTPKENTLRSVTLGLKPRGERHGMHKLTEENARKIRMMYQTGNYTQKELGILFGVERHTISGIVRNRTWRENNDAG